MTLLAFGCKEFEDAGAGPDSEGDEAMGSDSVGDGVAPGDPSARWIPIPHLLNMTGCQATMLKEPPTPTSTNATVQVPETGLDLTEVVITDYDSGEAFFLLDGKDGWVPPGSYIGDLGVVCTYRAPYDAYLPLVDHFANAFRFPADHNTWSWVGGEQVSGIRAQWELSLINGTEAAPEAAGAWLLLSGRYEVSVVRCEDPSYPPAVEETGEEIPNNAVCVAIHDGGWRALADFARDFVDGAFGDDGYQTLVDDDPGLTVDIDDRIDCLEEQATMPPADMPLSLAPQSCP